MLVKVLGTCVAAAGVALGTLSSGHAATDPFTITAPAKASFVVGGQVEPDIHTCDVGGPFYSGTDVVMRWSVLGVPAGDTVTYKVIADTGEGPEEPYVRPRSTTYFSWASNFNNDCGGGGDWTYGWIVDATTSSGATAQATIGGGLMSFAQDDGGRSGGGHPLDPPLAQIAYRGEWRTSFCECYASKTTHRTNTKGSTARVTVVVPDGQATHLALVMAKGPSRGSAQVYADGVLNRTINTRAATRVPRVVVWQRAFGPGAHVVRVVNLATKGHPRIDLDGVLTN